MTSCHKAICPCGFETTVEVGGSMAGHRTHATFPFLCKSCGIVNVNFRSEPLQCSKCGSSEIAQYGLPPMADRPADTYENKIMAWDYFAEEDGNYCPSCKQMTLRFHSASWLAD